MSEASAEFFFRDLPGVNAEDKAAYRLRFFAYRSPTGVSLLRSPVEKHLLDRIYLTYGVDPVSAFHAGGMEARGAVFYALHLHTERGEICEVLNISSESIRFGESVKLYEMKGGE